VPIAISPFAIHGDPPSQDVSAIITNDLQSSGRFKVYGRNALNSFPSDVSEVKYNYFRDLGADDLVIGTVRSVGSDRYEVSFQY